MHHGPAGLLKHLDLLKDTRHFTSVLKGNYRAPPSYHHSVLSSWGIKVGAVFIYGAFDHLLILYLSFFRVKVYHISG